MPPTSLMNCRIRGGKTVFSGHHHQMHVLGRPQAVQRKAKLRVPRNGNEDVPLTARTEQEAAAGPPESPRRWVF